VDSVHTELGFKNAASDLRAQHLPYMEGSELRAFLIWKVQSSVPSLYGRFRAQSLPSREALSPIHKLITLVPPTNLMPRSHSQGERIWWHKPKFLGPLQNLMKYQIMAWYMLCTLTVYRIRVMYWFS